jgi:hypothetical protein
MHEPLAALLPPFASPPPIAADVCAAVNEQLARRSARGTAVPLHHAALATTLGMRSPVNAPLMLQKHMLAREYPARAADAHPASIAAVNLLPVVLRALRSRFPATFPSPTLLQPADPRPARCPLLFIDVSLAEASEGTSRVNEHEAAIVAHVCASLLGVLPDMAALAGPPVEAHYATATARLGKALPGVTPAHFADATDMDLAAALARTLTLEEAPGTAPRPARLPNAAADARAPRRRSHLVAAQVGVVAPYVGQVREIRYRLEDLHHTVQAHAHDAGSGGARAGHVRRSLDAEHALDRVEVRSVDGFQGREKEVRPSRPRHTVCLQCSHPTPAPAHRSSSSPARARTRARA